MPKIQLFSGSPSTEPRPLFRHYLALERWQKIKQEEGVSLQPQLKRYMEEMQPGEMIGRNFRFSGVTYRVKDFKEQLYIVEDVENNTNRKKMTHTQLFSGDIAVNGDQRLKRRRVS